MDEYGKDSMGAMNIEYGILYGRKDQWDGGDIQVDRYNREGQYSK